MNEHKLADVLIIARGGGSLEDLWPFNEEIVARSIYASATPIISAVGHETDFTISDFVADLRAPTPSAAAELAVPNIKEVKIKLDTYNNRAKMALAKEIKLARLKYEKCMTSKIFKEPTQKINEQYMVLDMKIKSLQNNIKNRIMISKNKFIQLASNLDTLSPLKTLTRGYTITELNNQIIKSSKNLKKDDEITIKFCDGNQLAKIL